MPQDKVIIGNDNVVLQRGRTDCLQCMCIIKYVVFMLPANVKLLLYCPRCEILSLHTLSE
jgi:hypothetical protein